MTIPATPLCQFTGNLVGSNEVTCRSKIVKSFCSVIHVGHLDNLFFHFLLNLKTREYQGDLLIRNSLKLENHDGRQGGHLENLF